MSIMESSNISLVNKEEKIIIKENKTLKLNNVLIRRISDNEIIDINKIAYMMESYIKSKGNFAIGPMVNYSAIEFDDEKAKVVVKLMVQMKNPIYSVENPYEHKAVIKVTNCLFARFIERGEYIQFAYEKLRVHAFENNINLRGDSYTVFLKDEGENIVADIFMKCVKDGELIENI